MPVRRSVNLSGKEKKERKRGERSGKV